MTSTSGFTANDHKWMRKALNLAAKGAGHVTPNPLVGCVIVSSDGRLIGKGWHEKYGQAHAEVNAVSTIKDRTDLIDATVYVTLEPCAHHGKTSPCADMLASLPIKRVVIAMTDPNPQVDGKGIKLLRNAGKTVDVGLMEDEATLLNEVFIYAMKYGKAFVFLKIAQSLDGYIAAPDGDPEIFTDKESQIQVHRWRSTYDGVMVGSSTAIQDNPRLTVRHVEGRQPVRIVIDGPNSLPEELHLFSDQYESKTIKVTYADTGKGVESDPILKLLMPQTFHGRTMKVNRKDGHCDLSEIVRRLPEFGVHSVIVEGGQQLSSALIRENLVDKVAIFVSPFLLGGGVRSVLGLGIDRISERLDLNRVQWQASGRDMLLTGYF